jgi:hypothetical protein
MTMPDWLYELEDGVYTDPDEDTTIDAWLWVLDQGYFSGHWNMLQKRALRQFETM